MATFSESNCISTKAGGKIASYEISDRYRWLTAVRSTSIQTSTSRSGFSDDLDDTFERLYNELVL